MIDIFCNENYINYDNAPFYKDKIELNIDVTCNRSKNKILLFIKQPRINIDCIVYISEFNFNEEITEETDVQIVSKMIINHNIHNVKSDICHEKIVIMTKGMKIKTIVLHMPTYKKTFLRELHYRNFVRFTDLCSICYETKPNTVKVHANHFFCMDCILQWEKQCPLCRHPIL